jgi:hypothetical protein
VTDTLTRTPNAIRDLAERVHNDPEAFSYDGFGVMLSSEQGDAWRRLGNPGPRMPGEFKTNYLSGAQRGGKTVELGLWHNHACLYKTGVDNTDGRFWRNYLYKTLANAPTTDLTLKLWQVMDELSKGASDAQYDRRARRARGGAFLHLMKAGTAGPWPVVRFENGARTDFRSTEGWATRLEGDQWWFITWDEWASQPDREIEFVLVDVLFGRSRDHDAKIVPAAWPKEATERHLISAIRKIEKGDPDTQVMYLSALKAFFSNQKALETERRRKTPAQWKRTVLGEPAGGASVEFKPDMVENMKIAGLPFPALREDGYLYFSSWDIGLAHDLTVGMTWRIPRGGVTLQDKARLVNATKVTPSDGLTLDSIAYAIAREQQLYGSQSAVDASGLGGVAAFRQLKELRPSPLSFVAKSNDRIWGNMRLAAITNGLDLLSWGRQAGKDEEEQALADRMFAWGLIEVPDTPLLIELYDQLANFDRDAKNVPDDWVWSFLIGLWYIRRYWVQGSAPHSPVPFDPRPKLPDVAIARRKAYSLRRGLRSR